MFSGCSALLPALEPQYVVNRIVSAVLRNQEELVIPRLMYFMDFMGACLPTKSGRSLLTILGVDRSMDAFVGWNKKK